MDVEILLHDTTRPYKSVDYNGIEYTTCKDFDHISRYRRLRQVIHYLTNSNRFITLELQNNYSYENVEIEYYIVPNERENRLDLVSYDYYGSSSYSWIISYINGISDGFTIYEGQVLMIPKNITDLFKSGCILSSVPATTLNLGTE